MDERFEVSQYKEPTYKSIGDLKTNPAETIECYVEYKFKFDGNERIVKRHGTARIIKELEYDKQLAMFLARLRGTIKVHNEIQNILILYWDRKSFKPEQTNIVIDITQLKDIVEFLKVKLNK